MLAQVHTHKARSVPDGCRKGSSDKAAQWVVVPTPLFGVTLGPIRFRRLCALLRLSLYFWLIFWFV